MNWELTLLCHFIVIADGHTYTQTHRQRQTDRHTHTHTLNTIVSQPLRGSTNQTSLYHNETKTYYSGTATENNY